MRLRARVVAALLFATAFLATLAPQPASATTINGCPSGHVGVYGEVGGIGFWACVERPPKVSL